MIEIIQHEHFYFNTFFNLLIPNIDFNCDPRINLWVSMSNEIVFENNF